MHVHIKLVFFLELVEKCSARNRQLLLDKNILCLFHVRVFTITVANSFELQ